MNKILKVLITSCIGCPYYRWEFNFKNSVCKHPQFSGIVVIDQKKNPEIPQWCPLPNESE